MLLRDAAMRPAVDGGRVFLVFLFFYYLILLIPPNIIIPMGIPTLLCMPFLVDCAVGGTWIVDELPLL